MIGVSIAIDPLTDDLKIPIQLIRGRDALAQRLSNRFRFFLGEWFLDLRQGAPYYQYVLVKNPNERLVRAIIRRIIESTPGVQLIKKIEFDFNYRERRLHITDLEILTTEGETFLAQDDEFIIGIE